MPEPTSRIRFSSVFSKEGMDHNVQNRPDPVWMAWSGFGQTHLVQKQADVQESSGLVPEDRNQPATSFPLSDSVVFFHRSQIILCKTGPDPIWFWLTDSGSDSKHWFMTPSFNHCHIWLRHRFMKTVRSRAVFCWCSNSSKFVTNNSNYPEVCFITDHVAYTSSNRPKIV